MPKSTLLEAPLTVQPEEMIPIEKLSDGDIDTMIEAGNAARGSILWTGEQNGARPVALDQSTQKFLSLYVCRHGQGAQPGTGDIAQLRRAGRIKTAESAPLFERMVDGMMHDLQAEGPPGART